LHRGGNLKSLVIGVIVRTIRYAAEAVCVFVNVTAGVACRY